MRKIVSWAGFEASELHLAAAALDEVLEAVGMLEDHHPESPSCPSPESHLEELQGLRAREEDSQGGEAGRPAVVQVMMQATRELGRGS